MEIANFFWKGELSDFEKKCIESFVKKGFNVKIWSYSNISINGAESCDANLILPEDFEIGVKYLLSEKNEDKTRFALFSDYFRIKLISTFGGWWFDSDCLCLKNSEDFKKLRANKKIVIGKQNLDTKNPHHLANGVLYFDEEISKHLLVEFETLINKSRNENQLWGFYGPEFFTNYVFNNDLYCDVSPIEDFYSIRSDETNFLFSPNFLEFGRVRLQNSYLTHIWTNGIESDVKNKPPKGSFLESLFSK